jgi:homocitrate synthase NifV
VPTVYLIDVTNRDGVQASRIGIAKLQKTVLNVHLDTFGAFQSEAGFPNLPHETNYLNANVALVENGTIHRLRLSGWMRAIKGDVEDSFKRTRLRHYNISIPTSDQMITHKLRGKLDRESVIAEMTEALDAALALGVESVGVNAEDASRTDLNYLVKFAAAAREHGAHRVRYCDTVGCDLPSSIAERCKTLASEVGLPIELHCHNDLGMAVGNSVSGAIAVVEAGQDAYINCTINGVGDRAGNADAVSCVVALRYGSGVADRWLLDRKVDLSTAWKLARYASYAFGLPIPVNQPGVGDNMFAHESGIHADGALKDRRNYELYDYEDLGRGEPEHTPTGRVITTGEYGGIHGFRHVYESLGVHFDSDEHAREILRLVQFANMHTQKPLHEDELRFIADHPEETRLILTVSP